MLYSRRFDSPRFQQERWDVEFNVYPLARSWSWYTTFSRILVLARLHGQHCFNENMTRPQRSVFQFVSFRFSFYSSFRFGLLCLTPETLFRKETRHFVSWLARNVLLFFWLCDTTLLFGRTPVRQRDFFGITFGWVHSKIARKMRGTQTPPAPQWFSEVFSDSVILKSESCIYYFEFHDSEFQHGMQFLIYRGLGLHALCQSYATNARMLLKCWNAEMHTVTTTSCISAFQHFSISVFQHFSISDFQTYRSLNDSITDKCSIYLFRLSGIRGMDIDASDRCTFSRMLQVCGMLGHVRSPSRYLLGYVVHLDITVYQILAECAACSTPSTGTSVKSFM